MKDEKIQNMEYYLRMPGNNQYEIIGREKHQSLGTATLLYTINEGNISDGDGLSAEYDDKFVKINSEDYNHVNSIFKCCVNEIFKLGEQNGLPIDREIKVNDYLFYHGTFMCIESMSSSKDLLTFKTFFYDNYELDTDQESYDWDEYFGDGTLEDLKNESLLINSGIYNLALSKANAAIAEVQYYLKNLYMSKKNENGNA